MESAASWYYARKGERIDPVSMRAIKGLVEKGINLETKVWHGRGDCNTAGDTELVSIFNY